MLGYYIRRDGPNNWSVWHSAFGCNSRLINAHLTYSRAKSICRSLNTPKEC